MLIFFIIFHNNPQKPNKPKSVTMTTTLESIKSEILEQMPLLIEQDPAFCATLARALRGEFLPRVEAESRFDRLLDELRRDREEQNRKWEANQLELKRLHEEVMAVSTKIDRTIGGLGARWGMQSERAFRNALAGILEKSFGVQVLNVTEYDVSGEVFGRPDQVELDVIIKNGLLIVCELKSSVDKSAMYAFERKVRFYEKLRNRQADRLIVISPMIDPAARVVGERLGIEMYTDSIDVPA
ncbi:hypothetical protein SAMN06295888_106141 [Desulfonatronum zhilinae]|nr:hypothetical protein SAMN06295888_106141 [Desulfonatronum zhilinae]